MLSAVGRQGEEKFDGILDEIAAAAEAEDYTRVSGWG